MRWWKKVEKYWLIGDSSYWVDKSSRESALYVLWKRKKAKIVMYKGPTVYGLIKNDVFAHLDLHVLFYYDMICLYTVYIFIFVLNSQQKWRDITFQVIISWPTCCSEMPLSPGALGISFDLTAENITRTLNYQRESPRKEWNPCWTAQGSGTIKTLQSSFAIRKLLLP